MSIPVVSVEEIASFAFNLYGKSGELTELGSCQDVNYRLKTIHPETLEKEYYVVKISNSACSRNEIEFQNRILEFVSRPESLCAHLKFPTVLVQLDGVTKVGVVECNGVTHFIRMLTFVKGTIMSDFKYYAGEALFSLGASVASLSLALSDLDLTGSGIEAPEFIQWDLQQANAIIDDLLPNIADIAQRNDLARTRSIASSLIEGRKQRFRKQIVHGDLAIYNLVGDTTPSGLPRVTGVIDFGDAMRSWLVGDFAVCITSCYEHSGFKESPLLQAAELLRGFLSVSTLNEDEIDCLWPLIVLRSVVNIVSINQELTLEPDNAYNIDGLKKEWVMFDRIAKVPVALAVETFRSVAGLSGSPRFNRAEVGSNPAPLKVVSNGDSSPRQLAVYDIDLTTVSLLFNDGNWRSPVDVRNTIVREMARVIPVTGYETSVSVAYGSTVLPFTSCARLSEPNTMALGVDIFLPDGTSVLAPISGTVYYCSIHKAVVLSTSRGDFLFRGIRPAAEFGDGLHLSAGSEFGVVCNDANTIECLPSHLSIQHSIVPIRELTTQSCSLANPVVIPRYCQPSLYQFWSMLSPPVYKTLDISRAHILPSLRGPLEIRRKYVAAVQQHYYLAPPTIERAHGIYMYDVHGRAYLDMVNNVALVGHCNPRVVEAAHNQMQLLNTNSRFIYHQLSDFAEKIISKMPAEANLEVVFFVNSGSEATDLALRIARTVVAERRRQEHESGNKATIGYHTPLLTPITSRNVICLEGGYHGCSTTSDEISTTLNDNPRSRESRPPWIHLVPMPNPYHGPMDYPSIPEHNTDANNLKCSEAAADHYASFVKNKLDELRAKGEPCAAFIAEPLSGNAGGVELPYGYLQKVYSHVRNAGGLCICDEVQLGYGRLGNVFWGFEEHGVLPDIVTMAKAAGNGHPLGFVVTSRQIAEEFGLDGSFFSSAGGGPVSCAVGAAVLDSITEDRLQENALLVGNHLRAKLMKLVESYPEVVGRVHGHGLYMGVEIITDSATRGPGTLRAIAICRRLLELGVICHSTGDYSNVLKVKPPIVMTLEDADFFVDALTEALKGW